MCYRNNRGSEGEGSENPFFEDDDSSSDEQPDRPRQNQREDNRRWESGMRINIPEFDGKTLNPEEFIDWLVTVEEVFEFKEVPENKRVSLIATKLRVRCKKSGKDNYLLMRNGKIRGLADNDYEEHPVFDDEPYEEEVMSGDVGVNLMIKRSCLTPKPEEAVRNKGENRESSKPYKYNGLKKVGEVTASKLSRRIAYGDEVFCANRKEWLRIVEIPKAIFLLLKEFLMPHYKVSLGEHEELRRQVEELVSKGHILESMSQCCSCPN
ncbi:hypothetical protein Tco_1439681 [Tanacetum coccineum]